MSKVTNIRSSDEPSVSQFFKAFETGVKNQLINVHRFQKQGPKEGKVSNRNGGDAPHSLTKIAGPHLHLNECNPLQRASSALFICCFISYRHGSYAAGSRRQYSSKRNANSYCGK